MLFRERGGLVVVADCLWTIGDKLIIRSLGRSGFHIPRAQVLHLDEIHWYRFLPLDAGHCGLEPPLLGLGVGP